MGFQSYISKFLLLRSGGGGVGGGGVEKWRLKLTSAKVEVEVEAELGKKKRKKIDKKNNVVYSGHLHRCQSATTDWNAARSCQYGDYFYNKEPDSKTLMICF